MSDKSLKIVNILLWGGAALLIVGIVLSYSIFAPYLETLLSTSGTSAGTIIVIVTPTPGAAVVALLPFEGAVLPDVSTEIDAGQPLTTTTGASDEELPLSDTVILTRPHPLEAAEALITYMLADAGTIPTRVYIPDIDLEAPVVPIGWKYVQIGGAEQPIWDVPEWRAAGWHETSARIGVPGNTVLNGHNTSKGEVFRYLYKLDIGASIFVKAEDGKTYTYSVTEKLILPEAGQPIEVRIQNAQYIMPTGDERLTLVTCHPYGSLEKRLLIIATPVDEPNNVSKGGE
jgi:LPXTG-site transpeptidase (sortase) family protein